MLTYHKLSPIFVLIAVVTLLSAAMTFQEWIRFERGRKLGEYLFLSKFGIAPDKVKVLSYTYKYDRLTHGISIKSVRIKFWAQEKIYKGLVDMENEALYIKEPVLLPVYTDNCIPVWEEVITVHRNGTPSTVEFRDAKEELHGVDYLDDEGILKQFSWKRYKGTEVYWNPVKKVWEP